MRRYHPIWNQESMPFAPLYKGQPPIGTYGSFSVRIDRHHDAASGIAESGERNAILRPPRTPTLPATQSAQAVDAFGCLGGPGWRRGDCVSHLGREANFLAVKQQHAEAIVQSSLLWIVALVVCAALTTSAWAQPKDFRSYAEPSGWHVSFDGLEATAELDWNSEAFHGQSGTERLNGNRASVSIRCAPSGHSFIFLLQRPLADVSDEQPVTIRLLVGGEADVFMSGVYFTSEISTALHINESGITGERLLSILEYLHGQRDMLIFISIDEAEVPLSFVLPRLGGNNGAASTPAAMGAMFQRCRA